MSDWPLSNRRVREHVHYGCPEDVFEHDYDRLVQALTIVAGDKETAADAVQEAFVRLYRDRTTWAPTKIQPVGYGEWLST